jgi:hypothetical protein
MVHLADHNITPSVDNQLVLEQKIGKDSLEVLDWLPRRLAHRKARPFDQDLEYTTTELSFKDALRNLQGTTLTKRGERRHCSWGRAMEWLQHADVEHVMNPCPGRQSEAVGDLPNTLKYLERPCVARTQLAARTRHQGLCRSMKNAKPHPIPDVELEWPVVGVVETLSIFLGLKQTSFDIGQKLVMLLEECVHGGGASSHRLIWY